MRKMPRKPKPCLKVVDVNQFARLESGWKLKQWAYVGKRGIGPHYAVVIAKLGTKHTSKTMLAERVPVALVIEQAEVLEIAERMGLKITGT
jgi:hypothetical protein